MRVFGNRPSDRLTFSPRANLTPRGLPVRSSSLAVVPYLSLMTASCPPITLALPCNRRAVVTPPGQGPVDFHVLRVDHVPDPHLGDDRQGELVDAARDGEVGVA